jgi:hypothetical protein
MAILCIGECRDGDFGGQQETVPPKFEVRETEMLIFPPIFHQLPLYFLPFSGFYSSDHTSVTTDSLK